MTDRGMEEAILEMFHEQPDAAERLSVILSKNPQRLRQLLEQTDSEQTLRNLSILLPRLGGEAIAVVTAVALGTDRPSRDKATRVLRDMMADVRPLYDGYTSKLPGLQCCQFADAVTSLDASTERKAALLTTVLEQPLDMTVGTMLSELVACYPNQAYPLLMQRFTTITEPSSVYARANWTVYALCLFGDRFLRDMINMVKCGDQTRIRLALAGLDGVVKDVCGRLQRGGEPCVVGPRWINHIRSGLETEDSQHVALIRLSRGLIAEAADAASLRPLFRG